MENSWNKGPLFAESDEGGFSRVEHCGGGSEGGDGSPSVSAWRGSAPWRPGFSLLSHSRATPTLSTPQSRIPGGCQDLVLIPGAAPGPSLPCLGKAPCTSLWLLPRYACSPGGGSGDSGTQGCARKEAAGLREQPHCLCSAMCAKRFLANWEPLLLTLPFRWSCLCCLPPGPHISLPIMLVTTRRA